MHEQPQHDKPTEEVVLGPLVIQLAEQIEHGEQEAERDISYALRLDQHRPGDVALALLTDRLMTHCVTLAIGMNLIPEAQRPKRGAVAVETWRKLAENGPDDGVLGDWSYAKHLAQAGRDMLAGIREHRDSQQQATFVGREALPPVAADRL